MDEKNPVIRILGNTQDTGGKKLSLIESMKMMRRFFNTLSDIWKDVGGRQKQGKLNLREDLYERGQQHSLREATQSALIQYLEYLSNQFNWEFKRDLWPVTDAHLHVFHLEKRTITSNNLRARDYNRAIRECPVSLAITSRGRIEYTIDPEGIFPPPGECHR